MIVDQNNKVCPRQSHPLPLSVSLFRAIAGGIGRDYSITFRLSHYNSRVKSLLIPHGGKVFENYG